MYFGTAARAFLGGQALTVLPAADLGLVAVPFQLAALTILLAQRRRRTVAFAAQPGE